MPKPYSEDLRIRVVMVYRSGVGASEVAQQFGVSILCVYRWDRILQETGELDPLYKVHDRSVITDDAAFLAFAKVHTHSTLAQMAAAWEGGVSMFVISRKLKKLGIMRKKRLVAIASATNQNGQSF
jgi:transposase